MRYGKYGTSHLLMRLGLGVVFLWIGIDILRTPDSWIGFLPPWELPLGLTKEQMLQANGALDVALGILLMLNKLPRLSATVAALHLAGILVINGVNGVLIRDVGLFGTALALLFWPQHGYRRNRWSNKLFFWRRRTTSYSEEA